MNFVRFIQQQGVSFAFFVSLDADRIMRAFGLVTSKIIKGNHFLYRVYIIVAVIVRVYIDIDFRIKREDHFRSSQNCELTNSCISFVDSSL